MHLPSLTVTLRAAVLSGIVALLLLARLAAPITLATPIAFSSPPLLAVDARYAHDPAHILVLLRPGVSPVVLPSGATQIIGDWYEVPVLGGETASTARERWNNHPDAAVAELNLVVRLEGELLALPGALASVSDDPLLGQQWHLPAMEAPVAWSRSTGSGVVVAVVDSGVSPGPDLVCQTFVDPYNATNRQQGMSAVVDNSGHGTHVAGTIAQCTGNGFGAAGVAYDASLMPIKACDDDGTCTMANIARGIDWARQQGADVINLSLGMDCAGVGSGGWPDCSSSVVNQALDAAAVADIVLVASAGNANQSVVAFPANHPQVIAVGATGADFERAPYSSYGEQLSLVAPGGNMARDANKDGVPDGVLQETIGAACGSTQTHTFCLFQGTSMAAPHVAGAVALLRAAVPEADRAALQHTLERTARDLGAAGFDVYYGHGALSVDAALTELGVTEVEATPTPTAPIAPSSTPTPLPTAMPSPTPTSNTGIVNASMNLYLPIVQSKEP